MVCPTGCAGVQDLVDTIDPIYIHNSIDVDGVSYWLCWVLDLVDTIDHIYIYTRA